MNMNKWFGIYGQEPAKQILDNILTSEKIPHAFLFQGAEGIGKFFTALRFAQYLNSAGGNDNNKDIISRHIQNLEEPFVKYIFPLPRGKNETDSSSPTEKLASDELALIREELERKARNPYYKISVPRAVNIKISSIRDIKRFLSFEYADISYRIIIISEAHLMSEEAQNALLKSLEEPPSGVIFIILTSVPSALRETIRSRCWSVNFQPLTDQDTAKILVEYFGTNDNLARKISPFAAGSVKNALDLIDNEFETLLEKTIFILRYSFGGKYHSALEEFAPVLKENNSDSVKLILQLILTWLNDFQKYRYGGSELYFGDYTETLEKFMKRFPDLDVSETVFKIDRLSSLLKNNVNLNIIILNVIYELSYLIPTKKN